MCLITTQKEALIAKEAITVYKILARGDIGTETFQSPFTRFTYVLGKKYKTEIKHSEDWCGFDNQDTSWLDNHYPLWQLGNIEELICISRGFHSLKNQGRVYVNPLHGEVLCEATIPAGSEYYEDATGLLVSNSIIINKVVTQTTQNNQI